MKVVLEDQPGQLAGGVQRRHRFGVGILEQVGAHPFLAARDHVECLGADGARRTEDRERPRHGPASSVIGAMDARPSHGAGPAFLLAWPRKDLRSP